MPKRMLCLVRHGDIGLTGEKRYIGETDLPLSALGISQALKLRDTLKDWEFTKVYCSNLARSVQTADILTEGSGLIPEVRTELREMRLGEWEGRPMTEIARLYPEDFSQRGKNPANFRTPGGESFADLDRRVGDFYREVLSGIPGNVLVVGHAGVNRTLICRLLGMPLDKVFRLAQNYGCLNIISRGKEEICLQTFNLVP